MLVIAACFMAFGFRWLFAQGGSAAVAIFLIVLVWVVGLMDRKKQYVPGSEQKLPEPDRFMVCGTDSEPGCGYRSPTEEVLGQVLPDFQAGACPNCQGDMTRVDYNITGRRSFNGPKVSTKTNETRDTNR